MLGGKALLARELLTSKQALYTSGFSLRRDCRSCVEAIPSQQKRKSHRLTPTVIKLPADGEGNFETPMLLLCWHVSLVA